MNIEKRNLIQAEASNAIVNAKEIISEFENTQQLNLF